jgi:hypothetical protein
LFSTIQLLPELRATASANIRPTRSLEAPGVKGTTKRVTASACANTVGIPPLRASVAQPNKVRRFIVMLWGEGCNVISWVS